MMCEAQSGCNEEAAYEVYDRKNPGVRHKFCTTHYLRASRRAAGSGVEIGTVQLANL